MRPPVPIPTPTEISEVVRKACWRAVSNPKPLHIPVRLESYSKDDNCHGNAAEKVRRDGGQVRFGWVVWQLPDWSVRLEFHSVWQAPHGDLIDVTPPAHKGSVVLFVPDPVRIYEGYNVPMVHHPYNDSTFCKDYVEVSDQISRLMLPPGKPPSTSEQIPQAEMELLLVKLRAIYKRAKKS